jgi:hypothetical protein
VFAYVVVLILLVNGVHGSVRDYENDTAHQSRTTAVFFLGPQQRRPQRLPTPYLAYALTLQAAQVSLSLVAAAGGGGADMPVAVALCAAAQFIGTACLVGAAMHLAKRELSEALAGWHIVFTLLAGGAVLLASGRVIPFVVMAMILIGAWISAERVRSHTVTLVLSLARFADWRSSRR